jgi:hypothetical protein
MKKSIAVILGGALMLSTNPLLAADQSQSKDRIQTQSQDRERIYGSELMTEKERNEYRERIRNAKTEQEREKIRSEHHEKMMVRAKEKGVTLPDEPPAKGGGVGPGGGAKGSGSGGFGPGGGAGKGGGPKR